MKKDIYICSSYFHILISTIKALNSNNISELLVADDNNSLIEDGIINKLKKQKIFNNIIFIKYPSFLNDCNKTTLGLFKKNIYIFFKKKIINIDFHIYDEIYLFNDTSIIGRIINKNKFKYVLLEDGTDCYKLNRDYLLNSAPLKRKIKKLIGIKELATSKNIKYIEVNSTENVNLPNQKVKCVPRKNLFSKLNEDSLLIIKNIFIGRININDINNKNLLITQPLFEDGIISSEQKKIEVYKKIIDVFFDNKNYVIKTHPREKTKYDCFFPEAVIVKENFPIELLNYYPDLKFKKVVTISSTSIKMIENCDENIFLGWDWLDENKN